MLTHTLAFTQPTQEAFTQLPTMERATLQVPTHGLGVGLATIGKPDGLRRERGPRVGINAQPRMDVFIEQKHSERSMSMLNVFFIPLNQHMLNKYDWVEWRLGAVHQLARTVMMACDSVNQRNQKARQHLPPSTFIV